MNRGDVVQLSDLKTLSRIARVHGFDAIEGEENGYPVITVTIGRILFMATTHNGCLKLMYELKEENFPGGVAFANHWNTMNFMGTLIPLTSGFFMKHETLVSHGAVVGNVGRTLALFAEAIDRFLDEWFQLTST